MNDKRNSRAVPSFAAFGISALNLFRASCLVLRASLFVLLALAALLVSGCDRGPHLVKAVGTVTFQGKPLPGANVVFISPEGSVPPLGRTDEQGRFELKTNGKTGAPADEYKVAITAVRQKRQVSEAEAVGMTSEQIAANHESLIPAKYNNQISSGLTATVSKDPKSNEFSFELK